MVSPIPSAPDLLEQSHTNPTAKNYPGLNKNSWFLYLQMSFCSFLRLQFTVETNLLNSIRTGQRPLTPFIYDSLVSYTTNDTTSKMIFKANSQTSSSKKPLFPKVFIDLTISCVVSAEPRKVYETFVG